MTSTDQTVREPADEAREFMRGVMEKYGVGSYSDLAIQAIEVGERRARAEAAADQQGQQVVLDPDACCTRCEP